LDELGCLRCSPHGAGPESSGDCVAVFIFRDLHCREKREEGRQRGRGRSERDRERRKRLTWVSTNSASFSAYALPSVERALSPPILPTRLYSD
jgi:hypothetical protein